MLISLLLTLAMAPDPTEAWSETLGRNDEAIGIRGADTLIVPNEITPSRTVPAGRLDGPRAFVIWPEGAVTTTQLTLLDLTTHQLVWRQELSPRTETLLFPPGGIIAVETLHEAESKLKLRWFDRADGTPGRELLLGNSNHCRLLGGRWLLFQSGELRDATTGDLKATMTDPRYGSGLVVKQTLIDIVPQNAGGVLQMWLRQFDLVSGQRVANFPLKLRDAFPLGSILAADEHHAVVLYAHSFAPERMLVSLNLADGTVNWETPIPSFAPLRLIACPAGVVTSRDRQAVLAEATGLDINWNDGTVVLHTERRSPRSFFDWYVDHRSELLELRLAKQGLLGWFTIPGEETAVLRIDPRSGEQVWSTAIPSNRSGATWMKELSETPEFAVFLHPAEIHVVDAQTGVLQTITPETLGLPHEDSRPPVSSWEPTATPVASTPTPVNTTLSALRRGFLLLTGAAVLLLGSVQLFLKLHRQE